MPLASARPQSEFATGWPVLLGAVLGIAVGAAAIPGPAIGVVLRDLEAEFGWTRAQVAAGPAIFIGVMGLMSPVLGWFADRLRPALVCGSGLVMLALSLLLLSRLGPNLNVFYAVCAGMAVFACGAGTLPYARVVSSVFKRQRGFALGLALIGTGLTGMLLPALLAPFVVAAGWRQGFVALAVIVIVATPIVVLLLSRAPSSEIASTTNGGGASAAIATRDPIFWLLVVVFALIPLGVGGLHLHFVSYLRDGGVEPATAGWMAGLAGLFLIIGRVGTGYLVDRVYAPWVAATAMLLSAFCILAMLGFGVEAGVLGAVAIGLANGAEIDLIGYFVARYFGMRAYGSIYGIMYAAYVAGVSVSVVLYGRIYDATASYDAALTFAAAGLVLSALLFVVLGRLDRRRQIAAVEG